MNKISRMDKRGDLPVTLLVVGVFGVCALALISFFYSSSQIQKSLVGVNTMEKANIQIETNNLGHLYLYDKVTVFSPEWGFNWFKDKIIFSVEYNP